MVPEGTACLDQSGIRTLAAFPAHAKRFFLLPHRELPKKEHPFIVAKITEATRGLETFGDKQCRNRIALLPSDLERYQTVLFQMSTRANCDLSIGIEPIHAAVERSCRIEAADLIRQHFHLISRYIGRIRDD